MIRLLPHLLIIFMFITSSAKAQHAAIETLYDQLKKQTQNDTGYINTLADIGVRYQHIKPDTMLIIGDEIIRLSSKINYNKGLAHGFKIKGIANISLNNKSLALFNDSIAIIYYKKANDKKGLGAVYNNMGVLYNSSGELYTAKTFYEKSLAIRTELGDQKGIGESYNNLGNNSIDLGKMQEAIPLLLKGLEIRKQLNDVSGITASLMNLGNLYYYIKDFEKSKYYFTACLELAQKNPNVIRIGEVYNNMGSIFIDENNNDSAEYYFQLSLDASKKAHDRETSFIALNNLAEAKLNKKNYSQTLVLLNEASTYLSDESNEEWVINLATKYVQYYLLTKNYARAIKLGESTATKAKQIGSIRTYTEILKLVSEVYASSKNFEKAYYTQRLVNLYTDSLMTDQITKSISDFQYKYDIDQKEHIIDLLEQEKLYEGEKNKKLFLAFILSVSLLGLVSATLYVVFVNRRKEVKIRELTQKQNEVLDLHNQFKNRIFSIIAHDLRTPVSSTITLFDLLNKEMLGSYEFSQIQKEIGNQIKQMSLLLDNLLNWSRKQMQGKLQTHPSTINPFSIAKQNIDLLQPIYHKKELVIKNEIAHESTLYIDPDQLDIIIRNLLSNAMKFSRVGGEILISDQQMQDYYEITIQDNGVGMDANSLSMLFTTKTIVKRGTKGEQGTGLGLSIVKEFIEVNNGTISVYSQPSEGTLFKLKFTYTNSNFM